MSNKIFNFALFANNGSRLVKRVLYWAEKVGTVTSDINNLTQFALCPIIKDADELYVYKALELGVVPIIISDTHIFQFEKVHNYSSFSFKIGANDSELSLLGEVLHTSQIAYDRMLENGQTFFEKIRHKDKISNKNYFTSEIDGVFDFPVINSEKIILTERDIFISIWTYLGKKYPTTSSKPILLFGAGKFLKRLFAYIADISFPPNILGIADDGVKKQESFQNLTVFPSNEISRNDFDTILLATDSIEHILEKRTYELYGEDVEILKISELISKATSEVDVAPANIISKKGNSKYKRKLEGIVVCVGYSDFLSWTLPQNIEVFDKFVVVTSSDDIKTQELAKKYGAVLAISDCYKGDEASFNKGKMLNAGFLELDLDGWVLVTDADVLLKKGIKQRIFSRLLNKECLYYSIRLNTPSFQKTEWLSSFYKDDEIANKLHFSDPGSNRMPWGYFQLFHPSSSFLNKATSIYPNDFPTAGEVDYVFQELWDNEYKILLPETVVHIEHGALGINWAGRKSSLITNE